MTDGPSVTNIKYYFYVFEKTVAYIAFHFNVLHGAGSFVRPSCCQEIPCRLSNCKMLPCSMTTKITGFSYVTPCILVVTSKLSALKMVAACYSETTGFKYQKRIALIYFAAL